MTSRKLVVRGFSGLTVAGMLLASGCLPFLRPARVPLATVELPAGEPTDCLAILLPGRLDRPRGLVRSGFSEAVRDRGLALDLWVVDAHLGYYRNRSVVDRLRHDVVAPALAEGYREIWIVGASLGGLGTLLYAREHAADVTGVLAMAPFLGAEEVLAEIRDQGGPTAWRGEGEDDFRKLWRWLQSFTVDSPTPRIHLAYGTEDGLAPASELLAELVSGNQLYTSPGGHNWKVWRGLWEQFLDRAPVCAGPSPRSAEE